ncbi:MAG: thiamine pyrophosphate-dependent dehydrogenase E1 component subunit alpha, partial [Porticoccaceae bacterium]
NGYAISTPASEQFAGDGIAPRGVAYGIKTIRVDGNDILAVYAAAVEARKIAIEQRQPVLIETMSYRLGAHSTSDDPRGYRTTAEEDSWRAKDPINRMELWLTKKGWWTEAETERLQRSCRDEILKELKLAEQRPSPRLDKLITDVYKTPPPQLVEQLHSLQTHIGKYPQAYPSASEVS